MCCTTGSLHGIVAFSEVHFGLLQETNTTLAFIHNAACLLEAAASADSGMPYML
jgi:hypothetical protein